MTKVCLKCVSFFLDKKSYLPTYLPWEHQTMKNKFFFTAGMLGVLSGMASGATDGMDKGWFSEYRPYMTLRGGWLFGGDVEGDYTVTTRPEDNRSPKESIKNAWSGSGEFGVSCFDDRVFVGLELGYFTGKATFELPGDISKMIFPAEFGNTFGAVPIFTGLGDAKLWSFCGQELFKMKQDLSHAAEVGVVYRW